jgi:hypothetical protein
MTITGVYHLGYSQYRDDGIGAPETGNTIISMPMLLSTNPIGSVVVAHNYETEVPPASADQGGLSGAADDHGRPFVLARTSASGR